MIRRLPLLVSGLALITFLGGCAAGGSKSSVLSGTFGGWYSVTAEQTPFYKYGPQQGGGPNEQLPKDSIMKVIQPSFGYVKVQLQDGKDGYVAREDIHPASMALVTEKLGPPPSPVVASQSPPTEPRPEFRLNSSDPRLIAPPEPLPESAPEPTAIPKPSGSPKSP